MSWRLEVEVEHGGLKFHVRRFDKAGLHFLYNPYEIACGAIGDVEVAINLKTL